MQSARPVAQKPCLFTYITAIGPGVWQTPTMRRNPSLIYVAEGPPRCRAKAGGAKYALGLVSEPLLLWDSMFMSPCCRAPTAWLILQICEGLGFCASGCSPWWNTWLCHCSKPRLRRTLALSLSKVFESTLTIGGRLFWCLLGTLSVLALRLAWI